MRLQTSYTFFQKWATLEYVLFDVIFIIYSSYRNQSIFPDRKEKYGGVKSGNSVWLFNSLLHSQVVKTSLEL